jgi:hypothetical protein
MKIPFDGDPLTTSQTEGSLEWDDEPYVELDIVPQYMPPVSTSSIKVIALDLFGTILVGLNSRISHAGALVAHLQSGS